MEAPLTCVTSAELGKARRVDDAAGRYVEFCKSTFPTELDLRGWRIVVDCAHGAGYHVAPPVFHELGADVIAVGVEPNGMNINDGVGATQPRLSRGAGETERGRHRYRARRRWRPADHGRSRWARLRWRPAAVRDRGGLPAATGRQRWRRGHADEQSRLRAGARPQRHTAGARQGRRSSTCSRCCRRRAGCSGGENSGHIICLDKHTTGDAIVAALAVLRALIADGHTLAEATAVGEDVSAASDQRARSPRLGLARERGRRAGGTRGSGVAGRCRPGPAAAVGHRARRARDGRSARGRARRRARTSSRANHRQGRRGATLKAVARLAAAGRLRPSNR